MRTLGLLFILFGLLLCLSFIFLMPGLVSVGVGALLYMAGSKYPSALGQTTPGAGRRSAIAIVGAIAALILGSLVLGNVQRQAKTPQVLPVPRTEQNRVHPGQPATKPTR